MIELLILLAILAILVFAFKHCFKQGMLDEDTKYVVFDEKDKDKMDPKEFKKAMKVNKEQEKLREEYLAEQKKKK